MGDDVNATDKHGRTVLMTAAQAGRPEAVQALIEQGAYVNAKTNNGVSALRIASARDESEVVQFLREAGAKE
jgi:ankyrin repeat protein